MRRYIKSRISLLSEEPYDTKIEIAKDELAQIEEKVKVIDSQY